MALIIDSMDGNPVGPELGISKIGALILVNSNTKKKAKKDSSKNKYSKNRFKI